MLILNEIFAIFRMNALHKYGPYVLVLVALVVATLYMNTNLFSGNAVISSIPSNESSTQRVTRLLTDLLYAADAGMEGDKGEGVRLVKGKLKTDTTVNGTTIPKGNYLMVSIDAGSDGGGIVAIPLGEMTNDDWEKLDRALEALKKIMTSDGSKRNSVLTGVYAPFLPNGLSPSGNIDAEETEEYSGVIGVVAGYNNGGETSIRYGTGSAAESDFKNVEKNMDVKGSVNVDGGEMDF